MSHKSIIAVICLVLSIQIFARAPHERGGMQDDIFNYNQYGKIDAGMLSSIDLEITRTIEFFENEKANLGQPATDEEGKIRATIIIMIEKELEDIQAVRNDLGETSDITDRDLAPIRSLIRGVNISIEELKI